MEWIIAYLLSVFVATVIYAAIIVSGSGEDAKITISRGDEIFLAIIFCFAWPVTMSISSAQGIIKRYKANVVETAKRIIRECDLADMNRHDRTLILNVPEWKLKYVFKAYRRKLIELKSAQAEIIRDELMSRNMERTLLK